VMTLWSIFRSPLISGGDLPSNHAATTALIANEDVLQVDQRGGWFGGGGRKPPRQGDSADRHSVLLACRRYCFRFGLLATEDARNAADDPPQRKLTLGGKEYFPGAAAAIKPAL